MNFNATKKIVLVLLLWAAGLAAATQFAKFSVMLPSLREVYPGVGIQIGFLISILSLMGVILGLFAGLIATRVGFRTLLLASLLLGAVVSGYQATLPSFPLMLASRVLEGLSHLGIIVAAPTLIAQITPSKYQPMAMTLWGTFFGVAFTLVAWFGLPFVAIHGLPGLYLAHSGILLAVLLALYFGLPAHKTANEIFPRLSLGMVAKWHLEIYTSTFIAAPAIGWLFYTITFVALLTILPDTVAPADRAFVAGAMPLASIASSMTIGVVALRRITAIQVVILGFAAATVIALMLLAMPGHPILYIALFAALGLVQGASFAAIPQLNSKTSDQAYANGGMAQLGNLGNSFGTPLLLAFLVYSGFSALIFTIIACYILAIAAHLYLAGKRKSAG